jgi:hypothetical protein
MMKHQLDLKFYSQNNFIKQFCLFILQGIILRQEGKMQESLDYFQACQLYNPGHLDNLKQIAKSWYLPAHKRITKFLKHTHLFCKASSGQT